MSKLVTIYGGSGFVGRYIAQRMARQGWRVRVAVRRPNDAIFVRPYGTVGQVEPVFCNIRDDASVRRTAAGADAIVYCVGTFDARGKNNFDAVQHDGPARAARIATEEGVAQFVLISAIGADPDAKSNYARSKGLGEAAVSDHFSDAVILRPSIVFGPEDVFFNRFARLARILPVIPIFGAGTKFQPVYVDNVAEAVEKVLTGQAKSGVYELGGPDTHTFRELMHSMLNVIRRRRLVLGLPFWTGRWVARVFGAISALTGGIIPQPVTTDQIAELERDSVVGEQTKGLADLGVKQTAMEAALPSYLWQFRPSGQYAALKESAGNLRS